ncbi:A24 family peptidase [Deltaproteobacteria bacterium TL4]
MLIVWVSAILGGGVASVFLNRCVQRMPDDLALTPTLACSKCQDPLSWQALPVLGYFLFQRRCPSCQTPLPLQPLLVELLTIASTLGLALWHPSLSQLSVDLLYLYALIVITMIDWNTLSIEPRVVIFAISLRFAWLCFFEPSFILPGVLGMLIGAGAFYFIGFFYETLRRRQGLGDGDAAVLGLIGLWTGWNGLHLVVLVAAISGLLIGVSRVVIQKQSLRDTPIPFAPFLCLGGAMIYFLKYTEFGKSFAPWLFIQ